MDVGCGMTTGKALCLLIYGELGKHPDELVPWSQSLDSVPTRCDGFRNRFVTRQDHWDLMLNLTGTRTRGTYVP